MTPRILLEKLGYYLPLVIKPCSGGSSIGVYIVHTEEEYREAIRCSFDVNREDEVVIDLISKGGSMPAASSQERPFR